MYTALYRQWRPDTFRDVVGQDTIVQTLKNQLFSGHIAHAYLFCGSRGTGKTSTAKIFSRAMNCMSPTEDGPCGKCEACVNLSSENNMDIVEIDAASNNGVDEIRDLRDKMRFPPAIGKYKVYIIDEVHMLSMGAFNALLKTLEEPPAHVVFILATTEPHKLPATVLSRCQRFDFKRIPRGVMVERMKTICSQMKVTVEEGGLFVIARWAEGGMRDALSLLDQCMGLCGDRITKDDILNVLGTADQGFLFQAADNILSGDVEGILRRIDWLIEDGKDLNAFLRELLQHLRDLLVVKFCKDPDELLDVEDSTLERLKEQAKRAGEARLIRSLDLLSPLESELRRSTQPRILLELAAVKLCRPQEEDSPAALTDRIEMLEKQVGEGISGQTSGPERSGLSHAGSSAGGSLHWADNLAGETPEEPEYGEKPAAEEKAGEQGPSHADSPAQKRSMQTPEESGSGEKPAAEEKAGEQRPSHADSPAQKRSVQTPEEAESGGEPAAEEKTGEKGSSGADVRMESDNGQSNGKAHPQEEEPGSGSDVEKDPVWAWPEILANIKGERMAIYTLLKEAKPRMDSKNVLVLQFPPTSGFFIAAVEKEENRTFLEEQVQKVTGRRVRLRCQMKEDAEKQTGVSDDIVQKAVRVFGKDLVKVVDEKK